MVTPGVLPGNSGHGEKKWMEVFQLYTWNEDEKLKKLKCNEF